MCMFVCVCGVCVCVCVCVCVLHTYEEKDMAEVGSKIKNSIGKSKAKMFLMHPKMLVMKDRVG